MTAFRLLALLLLPVLPVASAAAQAGRAEADPAPAERARAAGALSHYDLRGAAAWRSELPRTLSEISGLAFASDGSLLAHGDERAVLWRYDLASRQPVGRFGLADRRGLPLHGDFEDLAVVGDRVFLVTGTGEIYEGRAAPDGHTGRAARRTHGLGRGCEVEGLTWDAASSVAAAAVQDHAHTALEGSSGHPGGVDRHLALRAAAANPGDAR